MPKPTLAIGIPVYGTQEPAWWTQLANHAAQLHNWVEFDQFIVSPAMSADINRNIIVKDFLSTKNEWLFWIDADTIVPIGAIPRMLAHGKTMVSGLYYGKNPPHPPIAYVNHEAAYAPLDQTRRWEKGEIIPVDSCGMGCMLTHRSVFEDMLANYGVYQRVGGGLDLIHKDDQVGEVMGGVYKKDDGKAVGGQLRTRLLPPTLANIRFPFFALEYCRTEDMWFFEKAAKVGHKPWLDTSVECGHLRPNPFLGKDYRELYGA